MGKGIILRVLEGSKLSYELAKSLEQLLPNHQLEYYKEKPNYKASIGRRIDSLFNAFLFILDAYPPNPKWTPVTVNTLKQFAFDCKKECNLNQDSLDDLHLELEQFVAKIVEAMSIVWQWNNRKPYKEAMACLNEAEQYVLMSKERPDLATLTPIKWGNEVRYVIQLDESLPSYYNQLIGELREIKQQKYCKTPAWFYDLPEYQQAYFCHINLDEFEVKNLKQDLNTLIEKIKAAKRNSFSYELDLESIAKEKLPRPSWYDDLKPAHQQLIKVLSSDPGNLEKKLGEFGQDLIKYVQNEEFVTTVNTTLKLPQWYLLLSERQQAFLCHAIKIAPSIEEAVAFISSRHRTIPAPANYAAHSVYMADDKGNIKVIMNKSYRSSHIASRDVIGMPELVIRRHAESNLKKVLEYSGKEQEILLQTLISPIHAVDYVPKHIQGMLPEFPPDLELYKVALKAIKNSDKSKHITTNNHPYNIAKRFYYTPTDDPHSLSLIQLAKSYYSSCPGLEELTEEFKNVLDSPFGTSTFFDYDGRELFLSSLEHLIILTMNGFSYGSCVSGKDRKALQLIHTESMIVFKEKYGFWPKFGDPKEKEERINFNEIFATLYLNRHQHIHAGQNAPGSEGIKTPEIYLPHDICQLINQRLNCKRGLEFDDRLATDNEVKHICRNIKKYFSNNQSLFCHLMAVQLGEKRCQQLYDALMPLINEKKQFAIKVNGWVSLGLFSESVEQSSTPKGIKTIQGLMGDENSGKNSVERLEKIFITVLSRPVKDNSRTLATNSIYDRIRELLEPLKNEKDLDQLVNDIVKEWKELFEKSKGAMLYKSICY